MTALQWATVKALFQAAVEQPPEARNAFLAAATADDALRREVESLLTSDTSGVSYLDRLPAGGDYARADPLGPAPAAFEQWPPHAALSSGLRVGPYEILAAVSAGAMGEVYRARDTQLHRDVALKVLPERFALDPDRLARFTREAHVLASLNHPNIAAIYGLEERPAETGPHIRALALEFVEGPTLADRVAAGPLPLAEALPIARQIVEAVQAAHQKGIIHRDLKPANIKITSNGIVKVLDFGLAKVWDGAAPSERPASPKLTATNVGDLAIIGTPAYMSPEQARGTSLDTRTDIWSFGCVLYEMLTGSAPFAGDTISDTIAAVLEHEPDWQALPAATPGPVRRLLKRCLHRDSARRLQDLRDARVELEDALNGRRVFGHPAYLGVGLLIVALLVFAVAAGVIYSAKPSVTSPSEYIPITDFGDSAVAPALSPDGRMVTFIRGGESFLSRGGQIYVKQLPDGEAVRLTNDAGRKYGPVFTPDGSRIAYTNVTSSVATSYLWDTWTVSVRGGEPSRLLRNASGLTWIADGRLLFSETMAGTSIHMGIVTAMQDRADSREIYFPPHESGMAHYSYASPDLKSVLVAEMNQTHTFNQPCRLLPFDGSSAGRQVGPRGTCTSAAWSPDGRWMYFGARVGGSSHLWRQRFPDGVPEQITFGPMEQEGVAVAPDGRSLITSAGNRRSAIWLHDRAGERPISSEGYALDPRFSSDGTRVFYLFAQDLVMSGMGWIPASAELRSVDVRSGKTDRMLTGVSVTQYDVSRDDKEVVFTTVESHEEPRIWLASLDRRTPPREIARGGDQVSFGAGGDVVFRSVEGTKNSLVRIKHDGSGRERITTTAILDKFGVSPDEEWVIAFALGRGEDAVPGTLAIPVHGGAPRKICAEACRGVWSSDGRLLYLTSNMHPSTTSVAKTLAIPVPAGRSLPEFPTSGIDFSAERIDLPGVRMMPYGAVSPGLDISTYVFTKLDVQHNLFRIPLH